MVDRGPTSTIAVIGGGIAGLAAAHRLMTAGADVIVLEGSARIGGKIRTDRTDGFLIEGGPDSFVAGKGHVLALAGELGLIDRVIPSRPQHRRSYVWWRDRLHPLPEGLLLMAPTRLSPVFGTSLLSWKGKLRVLGDLVLPRRRGDGDESLESFVTRRLGAEVLERIAEPLIAGIHAAEPSTMSLRASFPRLVEMERQHRSLILAARSAASQPAPIDGISHFASFKDGMGELPSALAGALHAADIRTGAMVARLTGSAGHGYRMTLEDGSELPARAVILATPAVETARLLSELSPAAAAAVADVRQVATATVTLAYRVDEIPMLIGSGFVVPSAQRRRIMGVSYLSQKWEGRVPDDSFALLRAFVGGPHGQGMAVAGTDRLVAVVREELAAIIGITASPVLVRATSWRGGLHQYTLGHLDLVDRARSALAPHCGVALAGAALDGIGLNECVASGRHAADAVLATGADLHPRPPAG